jgi:hypothetical protein
LDLAAVLGGARYRMANPVPRVNNVAPSGVFWAPLGCPSEP